MQVYFIVLSGIRFYAMAYSAESARRIFSRSRTCAAREENAGADAVTVSIQQVKKFVGDRQEIGNAGYDLAVRTARTHAQENKELRAMHKESYFNWSLNPNEIRKDRVTGGLMRIFEGMTVTELGVEQINL